MFSETIFSSDTDLKKGKTSQKIYSKFENFVLEQGHPCIMAQTMFKMSHVNFNVYEDFGSMGTAKKLLEDIEAYLAHYDFDSNQFLTFVAVFKGKKYYSEEVFENQLWKQLQALHEEDDKSWDDEVSPDPESRHFSFSLGGKAFYVVGMHPNSSRKSRQSPLPAIAFNLHWQFEKLRKMGVYHNVRDKIRTRDIELQGEINPMLEDFGENSEAKQYSGRKVKKNWKCPFHHSK